MDFNERYKVEGSASSLIGTNNINQEIKFKSDIPFDLSNNIHENIKILRDKKGVSQKTIAEFLGVIQSQIAYYEKKALPPADRFNQIIGVF